MCVLVRQPSCQPGASLDCRCAHGSPGVRHCSADGAWGECIDCAMSGGCRPGEDRECRCGGGVNGWQECIEGEDWTRCECPQDEPPRGNCGNVNACVPGEESLCGRCGLRTCTPDCVWSACDEPQCCDEGDCPRCSVCRGSMCAFDGECVPEEAARPCGDCGTQACGRDCTWGDCVEPECCDDSQCGNCSACRGGRCVDDADCLPGTSRRVQACDFHGNGDGRQVEVCDDSCRWQWAECTGVVLTLYERPGYLGQNWTIPQGSCCRYDACAHGDFNDAPSSLIFRGPPGSRVTLNEGWCNRQQNGDPECTITIPDGSNEVRIEHLDQLNDRHPNVTCGRTCGRGMNDCISGIGWP